MVSLIIFFISMIMYNFG
uniref:Uncharacterized protein n=1 Tax=Rhizophora mucronata TaxID=61149 RepID=A0A2P2NW67_RHIMU